MNESTFENVRFDSSGLVPAIVQDADSGDVLMLAYVNEEALQKTRETGRAHYWSRSRGKLWRKGETSGNEQIVIGARINCEQNSLLLEVRQIGAVCHEGYATCFYRTLADDGTLSVVRDRVFDPREAYGLSPSPNAGLNILEATRHQFGAYVFLRNNDLAEVSATSRRLRSSTGRGRLRIADELLELAGVLTGDHRHTSIERDVLLEASQVVYWLYVELVRTGILWDQFRPDRALVTTNSEVSPDLAARLLRADAEFWRNGPPGIDSLADSAHATLALVAQACQSAGVNPLDAVLADLDELRARPYLDEYFSAATR